MEWNEILCGGWVSRHAILTCNWRFGLSYSGSDLKWLQQVSDVSPHRAGALHRYGVVLVGQGQPVANDHIDISQTGLQGLG